MRHALISDIHGNLEAFQAVIEAISKERVDEYLCIGDVVGYGANPGECIKLLQSLAPRVLIAGNHEWAVLGLADIEYFNEIARDAVLWTRRVLDGDEVDYLGSFAIVHEEDPITLVHGTLDSPESFHYILTADDASPTIESMKGNICFVGHSHSPAIFYSSGGDVESAGAASAKIDNTVKYVVNVGSIGQPRDSDPRASYAVYDDETNDVEIKRVPYDIRSAQKKIIDAGLPEQLAFRLAEGV